MDGNGFTGFNPEVARQNIQSFVLATVTAGSSLLKALSNLIDENSGLKKIWCSPKAVEFSNTYMPQLFETAGEFLKEGMAAYQGAVQAYNIVAANNGLAPMQDLLGDPNSPIGNAASLLNSGEQFSNVASQLGFDSSVSLLYAAHPDNGAVGMNIEKVRVVLDTFKTEIFEALKLFDSIPTVIALYDTDGSQQNAFKVNVSKFKGKFIEIFMSMIQAIESAINTETNNIKLAKEQSTEALQANA